MHKHTQVVQTISAASITWHWKLTFRDKSTRSMNDLNFRVLAKFYCSWQVVPNSNLCRRLVTLCDPMWQVTLRNSEMGFYEELYTSFNFMIVYYFCCLAAPSLYRCLSVSVSLSVCKNRYVYVCLCVS